jgi:BirA family biotin operon repressor/biotin-[acetyl-CoA-carboxylase] ligase
MMTETRNSLLRCLADGRFHSGEELAELHQISRAAVWKSLKKLAREYQVPIDAVRGKGYRLKQPMELLQPDLIRTYCPPSTRAALGQLRINQTIDSTNSWLMQQAALGAESGSVCLAEQQTAGRGRHGRTWISPFGRNVYLSLLWRFRLAPGELAGMSLAAGIAVLRSLHQIGCHEAGLKWPNDILWRGRKLAGLLLEVAGESSGPSHMVIGVGLNIQLEADEDRIDQPWIDLRAIPSLQSYSRNQLVASLLDNLMVVIKEYEKHGLAAFLDEWNRFDLLKGTIVSLHSGGEQLQGRHLGISETGGIRLEVDGVARTYHAGEVSLRQALG